MQRLKIDLRLVPLLVSVSFGMVGVDFKVTINFVCNFCNFDSKLALTKSLPNLFRHQVVNLKFPPAFPQFSFRPYSPTPALCLGLLFSRKMDKYYDE